MRPLPARPLPVLGVLALLGLVVTPVAPSGSAGQGAQPFDGHLVVLKIVPPAIESPGGALVPRAAWTLDGGREFGGLSALHVMQSAGSVRLTAIADTGRLARLTLPPPGSGRVTASLTDLPRLASDGESKSGRDSESLARGADGGWWVGFEYRDEIRRYTPGFDRITARHRSRAMIKLPATSGLEALAALPGGRLLGIAETVKRDGRAPAFLWTTDARGGVVSERPLWFRPPSGYRATDATWLGDDRLLVLVRRFQVPEGFTSALVLVPLIPQPGFGEEELSGRVIARFGTGYDNAEGLSLTREGGRPVVWIVSDDNLSPLQRTVLGSFWLRLPAMTAAAVRPPGARPAS